MRVAIAGAGAVGRSIAKELLENGHHVLLIDKDPVAIKACVHEMRFDEASAVYAEFGPFYIGLLGGVEDVLARVNVS